LYLSVAEQGRLKCDQYWPDAGEEIALECDLTLLSTSEDSNEDYITRRFVLSRNGEQREIVQYQFVGWPDFNVPDSAAPVLELLDFVRARQVTRPADGPSPGN
jgi:protein tyrosine phosphatase